MNLLGPARAVIAAAARALTIGFGRHIYQSTYCLHGLCDDCRLSCKTCTAPCVHRCHRRSDAAR